MQHLVLLLALVAVPGSQAFLHRYARQAVHCQAGDDACQQCSKSCSAIEVSRLPECCEAYNACCDQYFESCKQCSNLAAQDQYFPEYCCASFTDCCHLVTTFTADVKPPEPVKTPKKQTLKIPTVAAPKPTSFPGASTPQAPPSTSQGAQGVPLFQTQGPTFEQASDVGVEGAGDSSVSGQSVPSVQPAVQPSVQISQAKPPRLGIQRPAATRTEQAASPPPRQTRPAATRTGQAASPPPRQARPAARRPAARSRRPQQANVGDRRGRVTSRGRVIS